ncbi:MAG TPA: hypothetical protein VFJ29_07280 [Candidatus Kapabacteria bacterium]|nr:hypothetical protein [Candidatus Kapabacteria bacterium]
MAFLFLKTSHYTPRAVRATREEEARVLPGDEFIPEPVGVVTNAITIKCTPHEVWQWLIQMGGGRAGWYSYDFIDNGGKRSAERIVPELQHVEIGMLFPGVPGETDGFFLIAYKPEQYLILSGPTVEGPYLTTWAFILRPTGEGHTRLIVRARASKEYHLFGMPEWLVKKLVPAIHSFMERKQLLGIARRAKEHSPSSHPVIALLDQFIPTPDVRERHNVLVKAPAKMVFDAACNFDMQSIPVVHAIFWARTKILRAKDVPRESAGIIAETRSIGWGCIAEEAGCFYIGGAVCQPWEPNVLFTPIPAEQFAAYAEPDKVKIEWTIEAKELGPALTLLSTETRAAATDEGARKKFMKYWRIFGSGIILIRWFLLPAVRRQAEKQWKEFSKQP